MDLASWQPDSPWTPDEWAFETRGVRDALAALGVTVPHCLPGEPADCGAPVWSHYATYLGLLKARAQIFIETNLGPGGPGADFAENVYTEELDSYRREAGGEPGGPSWT